MRSRGDDAAFSACFERHAAGVRATAYLLCGDRHRAEDLTQAAFLKLYLAWDRVDDPEHLTSYLRTLVVRVFLGEARRSWWRRERATGDPPELAQPVGDPDDRLLAWQLVAALPPRQRAVLVLRFWQDLDVRETAAALGCSEGTVKSQTAKALATLRARVAGGGARG
ncbi:RNA polymerase sigma factor [Actinokineospora bangkokensis]|uniref:RNA polymerase subunit sigma-24 n=1 Tax=Actinokineospora bangkokensis TaxID=1193682 RepID=A0A1Q9LK38_9PSEU|nr:SigE family RNA polymerase sigma factor [Actinokineospora bangkokensis]OLR92355.1 RNA polymerase subunit sigma-24 [Actinokineospora bangkokensis]